MKYKIDYKLHIKVLLIAIIISIVFYDFISKSLINFSETISNIFYTEINYINTMIYILIIMIPLTATHELIHGLFFKLFGGKVKYYFKFIFAATFECSGKPITLIKFSIVLLSPLIIISFLSLLLSTWLGHIVFLLNLIGSLGDIYMALELLKYPSHSLIIDKSYGYKVII
ncbi:DUF3267 domain-containing protein [Clostridium fallax]|uniref:Putative zincin peptidase n=1 Tax=Clostridium fallax TaxID=1533 RepID=A0A1M4Z8J2_9CLOT|nr:DUF3267 domain-containing protein [Clostridium fallax]SHF14082.1 Putative zincin peptidase [Clostridium fallax]SQB07500.1 Protein of uncharacterised function (DUF3267) [Clostridium fallax]